jgi:hypothetical protein
MKDDNQKKFIPQLEIAIFPIFVRCKTKCAVGAVYALLNSWQLGA